MCVRLPWNLVETLLPQGGHASRTEPVSPHGCCAESELTFGLVKHFLPLRYLSTTVTLGDFSPWFCHGQLYPLLHVPELAGLRPSGPT